MVDTYDSVTAVKASWIKRYIDTNNNEYWKITFRSYYMKELGNANHFYSPLKMNHLKLYISPSIFMINVLKHKNKIPQDNPTDDLLEQLLWHNSDNSLNLDKPLRCRRWSVSLRTTYYCQRKMNWHRSMILRTRLTLKTKIFL